MAKKKAVKPKKKTTRYENVILTLEDNLATIRLNRPKKKNACSPELNRNMNSAFAKIAKQDQIKVILITGGTGDSFCGGMDLEKFFLEPFTDGPDKVKEVNDEVFEWMRAIWETDAVTVASINGNCFGHGINIVGICDIAITAEDARFGLSEVNFGVLPAGGTLWGVLNNFNRKQGMYYSLTGEGFSGKEAVELGLVNRAVPKDQLAEATDKIIKNLVNKNALTLTATKKAYREIRFSDWWEAVSIENAKAYELTYFQGATGWISNGLTQFKDRKYKPGKGAYKLKKGE